MPFFLIIIFFISIVRSGKDKKNWISKMLNIVWVNADHGHDFNPLTIHMTKLKKFK